MRIPRTTPTCSSSTFRLVHINKLEVVSRVELVSLVPPLMNLVLLLNVRVDCDPRDGIQNYATRIGLTCLLHILMTCRRPLGGYILSSAHSQSAKSAIWQLCVAVVSTDCRDFITQHIFI